MNLNPLTIKAFEIAKNSLTTSISAFKGMPVETKILEDIESLSKIIANPTVEALAQNETALDYLRRIVLNLTEIKNPGVIPLTLDIANVLEYLTKENDNENEISFAE